MVKISTDNINVAKEIYSKLNIWKISNKTISDYFKNNMDNTKLYNILIKTSLLNNLYYTNLKNPVNVARHIKGLNDLDTQIIKGNMEAVKRIANWKIRIISFASKYCFFHNKEAFPIYDSYVCLSLKEITGRPVPHDYEKFYNTLNEVRRTSFNNRVSYEDIDKYLWLYGLKKALDENKKVNKEVKELYDKERNLFDGIKCLFYSKS